MQQRIKAYLHTHTNPPVFIISTLLASALLVWGVASPATLGDVAGQAMDWITAHFGWWYILSVTGFLVFVVYLLFSRYGSITIGKDGETPEWSTWSWFSMIFTAGMGIGLVFFGVAEPIFHLMAPPVGDGGTAEAARQAMNITFFHWGFHPWAVYIIIGLSLGYFCFRHDLPLRPAAAFYPLIGQRIYGWVGNFIDILAVFGTLFGLATSLGLGAIQINAGLASVFGTGEGALAQVIIIAVVTAIAVASVMLGIRSGIRRLSLLNMYLAIILATLIFIVGPTLFILKLMVESTGTYLQQLPEMSLRLFTFSEEGSDWIAGWTLFYWAWWIAWSPFVGMFLARISRGRTIRQFITGSLLAPVAVSIVWFSIFGGSALQQVIEGGNKALQNAGSSDAMFVLMNQLLSGEAQIAVLSLLAIVVVAIFFATSSDSGSLVVDMLTNGGDPHPIWQQRFFWAVLEGAIAAILLIAGAAVAGDPLTALQTASLLSGLPFSFVIAFMCWGLIRQLRTESTTTTGTTENDTVTLPRSMHRP